MSVAAGAGYKYTQSATRRGTFGWVLACVAAIAYPLIVSVPYYVATGITAVTFVGLAVAFDLVAGRIGALSFAQPLFFGFGAYFAALLSSRYGTNFLVEAIPGALAAALLAVAVGIASFRLSLYSFAIGTLGFALIGGSVAENWIGLTGGPFCVTGVQALRIPFPGGSFSAITLTQQYYVILGIAIVSVAVVRRVTRLRIGMAFTAVRDDPILAAARGLWPTSFRIGAFALAAALTSLAGAFTAHFLTVVCPTEVDTSYTLTLLIMVFIGGRGSLRGVVIAAVAFTVIPEALRIADQWRLAIYGIVLLVVVSTAPAGLEGLFKAAEGKLSRLRARGGPRGGAR